MAIQISLQHHEPCIYPCAEFKHCPPITVISVELGSEKDVDWITRCVQRPDVTPGAMASSLPKSSSKNFLCTFWPHWFVTCFAGLYGHTFVNTCMKQAVENRDDQNTYTCTRQFDRYWPLLVSSVSRPCTKARLPSSVERAIIFSAML